MVSNVLKAAAHPKEKKKSSVVVPFISVPQNRMAQAGEIRSIKEQLESLKTELALEATDFIDGITPEREKFCIENGFTKSVRIPDEDGLSVMLTWKEAYDNITEDDEREIEAILGNRKALYFVEEYTVTAKPHVLAELVEIFGDKIGEKFDIVRKLVPTKRYTEHQFLDFSEVERKKLSEVVRQYKPSISIR